MEIKKIKVKVMRLNLKFTNEVANSNSSLPLMATF